MLCCRIWITRLAALLLVLAGQSPVMAENEDSIRYPNLERLQRQFREQRPQPYIMVPRQIEPERIAPRRVAPQTLGTRDEPFRAPKVNPSSIILVVGDSLAEFIGRGLDDTYADRPDIEVLQKGRSETSLVRPDFFDWPKGIETLLSGQPAPTHAVLMIGLNDRQALKEGEVTLEPLSDRWRELYSAKVEEMLRPFTARRIPVIWVGLPPLKNPRLNTDALSLNDIYREQVKKAGGLYIDIWEAFVDGENRFTQSGPDLSGQTVRLRTSDGIHFTRAGARKAAHFAALEIKRMLESALGDPAAATPTVPQAILNQPAPVTPVVATRPPVGPVLPLTRLEVSPGGVLLKAPPPPVPDAAPAIQRAYLEGRMPEPVPGRIDDMRWPRP